jgi:hypothetical protein
MPLPFIVGGVIAVATAITGKKAYDGYQDNSRAEEISDRAKRDYSNAKDSVESSQRRLNNRTEELGQYQLSIGEKFKTFEEMTTELLQRLEKFEPNRRKIEVSIPPRQLKQIEAFSMSAAEFATGLASGAITGGAAAFAVYGGVMTFATASTGTAIATLSGAAATNAALAAIGGGALSAGGLGIAGGTALLGGVVAAPLAAVVAWSYASSAEKNLEKARKIRDEVEEIVKKCDNIVYKLDDARSYIGDVYDVIYDINQHFENYYNYIKRIYDLVFVERVSDDELRKISDEIKLKANNGLGIAACITEIIVTPLFKLKDDNTIIIDSDNVPMINKENMNSVINSQKSLVREYF